MTAPTPTTDSPRTPWRWRLALTGFGIALVAMTALALAGVEFRHGERDLTLPVALAIELAFGVWGFLLGRSYEARAVEGRLARAREARLEDLTALQARVAELEKLATVGQVAGSIAHEIRNPLAIVRSMIQNLAESADTTVEAREQAFAPILEEVDRLARVTDSLVGLARPVRPSLDTVEVREVVERAAWLAKRIAGPEMDLRTPDVALGARVRADPDLLCQVLVGLVANAMRVSTAGSTIDLECLIGDGEATFAVTDSGPGVPAELRDRVFEPFFTTRHDGTGLGLAVARQIVEAHGGRISVEDAPQRGARFVVRLALVTA